MTCKTFLTSVGLFALCGCLTAQSQIFLLDFESPGGYTTSDLECVWQASDYFTRTDQAGISATFSNVQGSYFFAAQDLDAGGCLGSNSSKSLFINNINVSAVTSDLTLKIYLAEDDDGTNEDWDPADYLKISYSIDGGANTNLLWLKTSITSGSNGAPFIDTDFDGVGDGAEITDTFNQFTVPIAGVGSSLSLIFDFNLNSGDEDIAIDHIEIVGSTTAMPPSISHLHHSPQNPTSSQSVHLYAQVVDIDGIDTVFALWGTASGNLSNSTGMNLAQNDTFQTYQAIASQPDSTHVYYRIVARDSAQASPQTDTSIEYSYLVSDPIPPPGTDDAWINEFHYDNSSTDFHEWIEVVIKDTALYKSEAFSLFLYNGSDSENYGTPVSISDTISGRISNIYGYTFIGYDPPNDLQNGPDAIALVYYDTILVQFLSYEGIITAANGPALGMASVDIGVSESGSIPPGASLQLKGTGEKYTDFTWQTDVDTTWGRLNKQQLIGESHTYTFNGSWSPSDPSGVSGNLDSMSVVSGSATLSAASSVKSLSIAPGASLDLGANTLAVDDTAYLHADATGYAQVIGEIDGVTSWESYLASDSARWFNVAVPVNASLADLNFSNGGFIQLSGNAATTNAFFYDATAVGSGDAEGDWSMPQTLSAQADSLGYSIYLGAPYFGSLPLSMTATGKLLDGNINLPIQEQSATPANSGWGWNFVPNPYPSSLDWDLVSSNPGNANLSTIYWIFNDQAKQWVAYNSAVGSLPPSTGGGSGADVLADRYIAPGQAFFIQSVSSSQTSFSLTNANRVLDQAPVKKKYQQTPNSITLWVTDLTSQKMDYNWIGFDSGATDDWDDRREGIKRFNNPDEFPALYYKAYGKKFIYNFVSDSFSYRKMPLHFKYGKQANLNIDAALDHLDPAWQVELEDKLTKTFTDLRSSIYSFQHSPGNASQRFVLHIKKSAVDLEENSSSEIFAYVADEQIRIDLQDSRPEAVELMLYDMSGRLITRQTAGSQLVSINMTGRARGLYLVKVTRNDHSLYSQKVSY